MTTGNAGPDTIDVGVLSGSIDAGAGDDVVTIHGVTSGSVIDGGDGYDTLELVSDADTLNIVIRVGAEEVEYQWLGGQILGRMTGFEFFRGSAGRDVFWGRGAGHRFVGGDGDDYFTSSLEGGVLDIVDYSEETGGRGVLINFGASLFEDSLPDGLAPDFKDALRAFLEPALPVHAGFAYDTWGNLETIEPVFRFVGSKQADVFYGGWGDDVFEGGEGADLFFGGEGNDEISGGAGIDTVYLSGAMLDYTLNWTGDVCEIVGPDGTDIVSGVEVFEFADGTIENEEPDPVDPPLDAADDADEVEEAGTDEGESEAEGNVLSNDTGSGLSVSDVRANGVSAWTDVDAGTEVQGLYGKLTISPGGDWSYVLDQALAQSLKADQTVDDIFNYRATADGASDEADLTITVCGSNDAPTSAADAYTTNEDVALVTPFATLLANDADPEGELLTLVSVQAAVNGTVSVSGSNVTFEPTAGFHGAASYSYTVQDASGGTATHSVTVTVNDVNDAPIGANKTLTIAEDGSHQFSATNFGFTDTDGDDLTAVTIVTLPTKGTLKLNGANVGAGQEIGLAQLANLTWASAASENGSGYAAFTFKVRDDGGTANGGIDTDQTPRTVTFNVTPVNDAPNGAGSTVAVLEDTPITLTASALGYSDPDGDGLKEIVITSLPGKGVLMLGTDAVSLNQVIAAAQLPNLKWVPPANESGTGLASFTFKVRDGGGTNNGGVDTDATPGIITFNVASVNDAPNGAGSVVATGENTTHVFNVGQFGFSDADGDELRDVVIASLPGLGVLSLEGAPVTVGQVVTKAQLASLTWATPAGASGTGLASFTFNVRDMGGVANGGIDTDPSAGTITFNVAAMNKAPSAAGSSQTLAEDQPYVFSAAQLGFSDPNGDSLKELIITALPGKGVLRVGGAPVVVNQVIAADQLSNLVWSPPAEASGANFAALSFKVRDTGGTLGGGADTAAVAGTMRFNVTLVNDAPTIATSVGSGPSGAIVLTEGTLSVTSVVTADKDSKSLKLSLLGEDRALFVLTKGQLQFKPPADFEAARDANKDNVYKVSIRVLDNGAGAVGATQDLTITVLNRTGNIVFGDDLANTLDKTKKIAGGLVTTGEEDRIDGKGGNDIINALEGNDTIIGGLGADKLTGGAGADQFWFDSALGGGNVDTIADFVRGTDDIGLAFGIFGSVGATLEAGELRAGKGIIAAADPDDFIIYNTSDGKLYYDADGSGAVFAAIQFATLTKKPLLDAGDFIVV